MSLGAIVDYRDRRRGLQIITVCSVLIIEHQCLLTMTHIAEHIIRNERVRSVGAVA